jgi:hypothetical protein
MCERVKGQKEDLDLARREMALEEPREAEAWERPDATAGDVADETR